MRAPLVGRDEELAWIRERLDARAPGAVLAVTGEAGVGKTRFVTEAVPRERVAAWVSFPQADIALPGFGLLRIAELSGEQGQGVRAEFAAPGAGPSELKTLAIFQAANALLAAAPDAVVVLDDVQWADELTLAWLSQLEEPLQRAHVKLVLGVRVSGALPQRLADPLAPLVHARRLHRLVLQPLSVTGVTALAHALGHAHSARFAERLHHHSGGLPLAVEELLAELERRGVGLDQLGGAPRFPDLSALPVLAAAVRQQLGLLTSDACEVLDVAALLRQPASEATVREVTGFRADRFDAALEDAFETGLLTDSRPGVLQFRHDLHRQAVQMRLPVAQRRLLHRRIAAALLASPLCLAAEVAGHLSAGGLTEDALTWAERAAEEAARVHDHGNALAQLATALGLCAGTDADTRTRLAERVVVAARCAEQPSVGLELIDGALADVATPQHQGRLLLCRSRLVSWLGDFDARTEALTGARHAFSAAEDDAGLARALGELALPVGRGLGLSERLALGEQGLALARVVEDPVTIAICANNLAAAKLSAGDAEAFELWHAADVAVGRDGSQAASEEALRNLSNCSRGALAFGRTRQAAVVIDRGLGLAVHPQRVQLFQALKALLLWRGGRWDDAAAWALRARGDGSGRADVDALACTVAGAIAAERERHPSSAPLAAAAQLLVDACEVQWAGIAQAGLMRIRHARREPQPCRGLAAVVELIRTTDVGVGWDDLLPAAAQVDPRAYRDMLARLGALRPLGERAAAACLLADGYLAASRGEESAEAAFIAASEAYDAVGEPYMVAQALEAAAAAKTGAGRRAGDIRVRAAELYEQLGADRSLAGLLRRSNASRALQRFRVPSSQSGSSSPGLTPREQQVADLARRGDTAEAIAEQLRVSRATVEKHLERVKQKLGAARKSDLVRILSDEA